MTRLWSGEPQLGSGVMHIWSIHCYLTLNSILHLHINVYICICGCVHVAVEGTFWCNFWDATPISLSLSLSLSLSHFPDFSLLIIGMWSLGCKGRLSGLRQANSRWHLMGSRRNLRQCWLRTKETDAPSLFVRYVCVCVCVCVCEREREYWT